MSLAASSGEDVSREQLEALKSKFDLLQGDRKAYFETYEATKKARGATGGRSVFFLPPAPVCPLCCGNSTINGSVNNALTFLACSQMMCS